MTAYTLAADTNIDALTPARTGGDTVDTNGFVFTIDQDTRYGLGGGSAFSLGNLTLNATKGGRITIDATAVRLIPYNTGTGNVPAYNTTISQGGASGKLIAVMSALNAAPTAPDAAMPASGFIKIKQWNGTAYAAGALTGISASATGPDVVGFIELVGDEGATINANRLAVFEMKGAWFEVGTTSGSSATTYQLPTHGSVQYYPALFVDTDTFTVTGASWSAGVATYSAAGHVFVEGDEVTVSGATPSGYNVTDAKVLSVTSSTFSVAMAADPGAWTSGGSAKAMEAYLCAGSLVAAGSTATDAVRGKVFWATTAGVLRFGSDGTNTVGYVPPAGRRIRMPNILTANCTTAARGTNALPNATLATRYDFTSTGGGVISIDKAILNWYPSFTQAFSVNMSNCAVAEQLSLFEVAQAMTITRVGVGMVAAQAQFGLLMSLCFAGGKLNGCFIGTATLGGGGRAASSISDVSGFVFNRCKEYSFVLRSSNAASGSAAISRAGNCTWINHTMGGGGHALTTCKNLTYSNTVYFDAITTTGTVNPMNVWNLTAGCSGCTFDGLSFGGLTNVQPYNAVLNIGVAGCSGIKLRNVGTQAAPLSLGSTNGTGKTVALAAGAAAENVKVQRVFTSNTRTNFITADNSSKNVVVENSRGDYADAPVANMLAGLFRGVGATPTYSAQTSVYGTHWFDHFTSATAGRIAILMNESTAETSSQVSLTGGAAFTSTGGLYMPTIGMSATFEMPYFSLGHSSFTNTALVMAGGTATNYTYAYQIDTGSGFGAWSSELSATALGTALSGISISASTGFKLKLRITTSVANTTAITSVYVTTGSSSTAQENYYPLDTVPVTVTVKDLASGAPVSNARVRIVTDVGGFIVLEGLTNASGVLSGATQYAGSAVSGTARRATAAFGTLYKPGAISGVVDSVSGFSATVLMISDE